MGKIKVQEILGNLLHKLQKLYINGPRDIPAYPGMIVINQSVLIHNIFINYFP